MAIKLEIEDGQVAQLKEFFLDKEIRLKKELESVQDMLKKLGVGSNSSTLFLGVTYPEGYNPRWVWQDKVKFALKVIGEGTTTEIVNKLVEIEPNLEPERRKVTASVSAVLSVHSREGGVFSKKTNERNEFVYYEAKDETFMAQAREVTQHIFPIGR